MEKSIGLPLLSCGLAMHSLEALRFGKKPKEGFSYVNQCKSAANP